MQVVWGSSRRRRLTSTCRGSERRTDCVSIRDLCKQAMMNIWDCNSILLVQELSLVDVESPFGCRCEL